MGHFNLTNNYQRGDSSGRAYYLSPSPGAISSGIIAGKNSAGKTNDGTGLFSALPYAVGVFSVAFLASCLTASIMTPVQNSDATQQVSLTFDDSGYYATVSASGTVDIDLIGTSDGATAVASDTVTVTTNSTTGYKLYISSDSTTTNANRLNYAGSLSAEHYLSPTTGTVDSPAALATNSWGYTTTSVTGNTNTITGASNFIGLPLLYNENLLTSYSSAATSGHSTVVYYGVKANTALPSGSYSSIVEYTVIAEGNPAAEGAVALDKSTTTNLNGGETITISTGVGWNTTSSDNSIYFSRSLYNPNTTNCSNAADINANNNYSYNSCAIRDGDSQIIGTYYNWRAATAGTGTTSISTDGTTLADSICPAGWQLPVNGNSSKDKSWAKLINGTYGGGIANGGNVDARNNVAVNNTPTGTGTSGYYQTLDGYHIWALTAQMRMAPLSIPFAGYYYMGGSVYYVGGEGLYWSSTASGASYARDLLAYAGLLYPQNGHRKGFGSTVRCVAQ